MITLIGGRERTLFLALLVTLMTTLIPDWAQVPTIKTADSPVDEERHPDPRWVALSADVDVHRHAHAPSVLVRHPLHGGAEPVVPLLGEHDEQGARGERGRDHTQSYHSAEPIARHNL